MPRSRQLAGLVSLMCAGLCASWLGTSAASALPASGVYSVPEPELAFWAWYGFYGVAFVLLFAFGLEQVGLAPRLAAVVRGAARSRAGPWVWPFLAAASSFALRVWVLRHQSVADDEDVYLFAARTLLEGRVANPLPDEPAFFQNQFIVLNSNGWFGKYPIGHSLLLALALKAHLVDVIFPLLGGLTASLTWRVGRAWLGPRRAMVALALLCLSPHFLWTHATLLSQTTTCFALMAALAAVARGTPSPGRRWAAGAALALGLLARPMPGALFVPVVMVHLWRTDRGVGLWARARKQLPLLLPVLGSVGVLALVNAAQAGSPLTSGYHTVHGGLGWFWENDLSRVGNSVFGATLRENFWLFGWPLSLFPVFFARPRKGRVLLCGALLAQLAYRVAFPKTVVSTTGPIYITETVPVLALLAADGLGRLRLLLGRWWGAQLAQHRLASALVVATLCTWVLFTPAVAANAAAGASARAIVGDLLEAAGAERAVVFCEVIVNPSSALTWAYYPPNPDPRLEAPQLFLRWPKDFTVAQVREYVQRHFPDRRAFLFALKPQPRLIPLEAMGP